ncbi:putative ABC transporter permease/ATP-binding protein [Gordonia effusa NBRC 100432]|uniref:Putative ABC transporter permease/ATP-binding protein n=1 Tax=Gordonia effusa NBRC 100432 TaxID=1077974 RepID=H0QVS9_9ACTN|nr:ABC transporter ATP-binding protein [Gordonia effusa]GAB16930.1 putative ABC transporter permease/ATP-binding protein [Gordonia effusa NBRC 100432]
MNGPIARLLGQVRQHRTLLAITLVATLAGVAADVVVPLVSRAAVDQATGERPAHLSVTTIVVLLVILAIVVYGGHVGRRLSAGALALRVQNSLRRKLLDTVLHLSGNAQDQIRTGQVVSRSISDLQQVQGLLAMGPLTLGAVVQVLITVVIMAYLSPILTLVALLIVPAVGVVAFRSRRKLYAATWSAQQAAGEVASHVEETVTGVRVVKGFGQEDRAVDELVDLSSSLYAKRIRVGTNNARFAPTMAQVPQLGLVAVLAVGGYLAYRDSITVGTFLAFTAYVGTMTATARLLTNFVLNAQLAGAAASRVFDVVDTPPDHEPAKPVSPPDPAHGIGIQFRSVSYRFADTDATRPPTLDRIDLAIAPGECVAVVGGPGSGKTTLANLLERHYRPTSGTITLSGAERTVDLNDLAADDLHRLVAVVSDDPFLYSDTVAANIGLTPHSDDADQAIADAATRADAVEFINGLPDGFDSVVGERGLTLSGGQRQRIALARALFANPAVLVLDDATSAVDATTEARIFSRLRTAQPTMLVLAHRRSTLALADRVAVLEDGRITDVGTVAELTERSSHFRLLMSTGDWDSAEVDHTYSEDQLWPAATTSKIDGDSSGLGSQTVPPTVARTLETLGPAAEEPGIDAAQARKDDPRFSLRQILRPVRWLLAVSIGLVAVDTLASLAFPTLARATIDSAVAQHLDQMAIAVGIGVALVIGDWICGAALIMASTRAGERMLFGLRVRSYAHLQRLGLDYFERELSGRIMTRMTTDIDALSTFLQTGLTSAAVAVLTLAGVSVALVITDPLLGMVILIAVLPVLVATTIWFRRVSSASYTHARELVSVVNADFQENIAGVKTSRGYRHGPDAAARFAGRTNDWYRARMTSQRAVSLYFPFIILLSNLAAAAAIGIGSAQIADGGSAGTLIAFLLYLSMLFGPIQQLTQVFDGYQQAAVGLRRIGDLLRTPSSLSASGTALPPSGGFDGHAALDDVTFRYGGLDSADDVATPNALSNVDLEIPPGTSLALVGQTGAGKSTIVKLLARFYDTTSGAVRMDGTDIRDFALRGYRQRLAIVPQEPHLFTGSIADNIAYGRPTASREDIVDAARAVGALDMIAGLDGAMTYAVGERGRGLSSGQRQLIALARAELVQPDLILLDEATATLDQATEARVLAAGERVTRTRTSVIVAHRLATASRTDRIAVVEDGRIVELGTHDQLLAENGRYQQFWRDGASPDADTCRLISESDDAPAPSAP